VAGNFPEADLATAVMDQAYLMVGVSIDDIVATLYAYSHLSFSNGRFVRVSACHYHRLREFMFEHPEVKAILGATD